MFKRFIALVSMTLTAIVGTIAFATPAMAIPQCPDDFRCQWTWYNDAAKTTIVGMRWQNCDNTGGWQGTQTPYMDFIPVPCDEW